MLRKLAGCGGLVPSLLLAVGVAACVITRSPVAPRVPPTVIYDISQLNPVTVDEIVAPATTEEIVAAVKRYAGPISIGGSRHSMGGQTAAPGGLQIDMRRFDRIIAFDSAAKTITVQAGIRWRQILQRIDSANLSVEIMQSYANFTVGGSLSVNAHGRYVGFGPLVSSVRSIRIVLAAGDVVTASRDVHSDIFYGAIGGYGAIGVITEATLELTDNVRVRREQAVMPIGDYRDYFLRRIRDSADIVFHNADIYPGAYTTVRAVSYVRTTDALTVRERLIPLGQAYRVNKVAAWMVSEWPFGQAIRRRIVDPWRFHGDQVEWQNHEASLDANELEPASRTGSTYVLQEYFVPVERFNDFIPPMRAILQRHHANVINVSIRHARPDTATLLSWAPREVFAFVVYYKQKTDTASQRVVGEWTRELIDAVLALGGTYYLPYQLHATREQFLRAYPRAPELFALKKHLDPTNKFTNMLWNKYYLP